MISSRKMLLISCKAMCRCAADACMGTSTATKDTWYLPCIQQRHVDHADIDSDDLRQNAPLLLNLLIISSKPVDAHDVEQIARLQCFLKHLILRPEKILSRLLVQINTPLRHILFAHGNALPALILILAGHPDISIYAFDVFHSYYLSYIWPAACLPVRESSVLPFSTASAVMEPFTSNRRFL